MTKIATNQQRTFLRLLTQLRPHWHRDFSLPARIQALLASHRSFGSRDRRLYRELIYTTLRYLPWIEPWLDTQPDEATRRVAWLAAETPATKAFCSTFATGAPMTGDKSELLPAWFRSHCPALFELAELEVQLRRAPLWLRLQTSTPAAILADFDARGWQWRRPEVLPTALELITEADVTKTEAWNSGQLEVQDLGSQLILESVGIKPGGHWLDACAGAGGKTLQLAQLLGNDGRIDAHDVRPVALAELEVRALRAGVRVTKEPVFPSSGATLMRSAAIRTVSTAEGQYDGVLIDAPCSGSGTWRRSPHLKWVTTDALVSRSAETQRALLHRFSAHVKAGGRLVYATCSLSSCENEEVVRAFLAEHVDFQPEPFAATHGLEPRGNGLTIMPSRHDTDGFFVASLRRD